MMCQQLPRHRRIIGEEALALESILGVDLPLYRHSQSLFQSTAFLRNQNFF
jgi:hypothetical protein